MLKAKPTFDHEAHQTRCLSHSTGNPFISTGRVASSGWRLSRIASTISGASSVSRSTRLRYDRLIFSAARELRQVRIVPALQYPLPPVRPGQRLDERAVDARPRVLGRAVGRDHELPSAALPDGGRRVRSGLTTTSRDGVNAAEGAVSTVLQTPADAGLWTAIPTITSSTPTASSAPGICLRTITPMTVAVAGRSASSSAKLERGSRDMASWSQT